MEDVAPISVTDSVGCDETLRPRSSGMGIVELGLMLGTGTDGPAWYEFARGRFALSELLRSFRGPRRSPVASSGELLREGCSWEVVSSLGNTCDSELD